MLKLKIQSVDSQTAYEQYFIQNFLFHDRMKEIRKINYARL